MDVTAQIHIPAAPEAVAQVMFDPRHDPDWITGVKRVETEGGPPRLGQRIRRHGRFLGFSFAWVTETTAVESGLLEMRFVEGPMKGRVVYRIVPDGQGALASVRNQAKAAFELPGMGWLVRRSVQADLERLKAVVGPAR